MVKMNKKGFMVTIEAVIAIVIVLIFMLTTLLPKQQEVKIPENIKLSQERIIQEIESREDLRNNISNYPSLVGAYPTSNLDELESSLERKQLTNFIKDSLDNPIIDFNYTVCNELNQQCIPDFIDKDPDCEICTSLPNKQIYAKSIMISSSESRIFRLYLWETI